ncbi:hypothetical protein [Photobacterium nomapromontoriensis]|uniref:hypothetical protein n=1 Tax=Photobacterium nomapromontoriensis TaxID=2910237 RepID=UPI003D0B4BB9
MRKTNIMLLAALVASPLALANGGYGGGYGGGYDDYDGDVTIEGSKNKTINLSADISKTKTINKDYVGNEDNDVLKMKNVGNTYTNYEEDNSQWDGSVSSDTDKEINTYLAESILYGSVMDTSVTYGGVCCKGSSSDVLVDHSNVMGGAYQSASGINIAGQNVGNNSLVQQSTSTNAALVGSGGATLPGSGGSY